MTTLWVTLAEWRAARRISPAQYRELDVAGIAPDVTKCAGVNIVTQEASVALEKAYGLRVVEALFNAAQSSGDELGDGAE